jgi:hypothetical protein
MRTRSLILLLLLVPLSGCIVTYQGFPNATLESLPKDHEPKPLYYHVEPIITQAFGFTSEAHERAKAFSRLRAGLVMFGLPTLNAAFPQVDPIDQPGYHEVARTLRASGMFTDMIEIPEIPEIPEFPNTGVYCYVDFIAKDGPEWLSDWSYYISPRIPGQGIALYLIGKMIVRLGNVVGVFPYYAGEGGTTVIYRLYRDGQLTQTYRYPITKKGAGWIVLLPFAWLNFVTNDLKDAVRGATIQFLIDAQRDGNL